MARDGERGRGDWKARSGSHNSGPYAEASGGDTGPVDIAAVRRDDELIDAIAGDGAVQTGSADEYQLAALLANWRAEIVNEPMPAGPDLDSIVAAVNQEIGARQARIGAQGSRRLRLVRPLMGAAAAVALIIGGMTAFSYSAEPGDPLWRVKEVVFSEQAQTTVVNRADSDMQRAQTLIDQGKPEEAKALLVRAETNVNQVNDAEKKDELNEQWQRVLAQLNEKAPSIAASLLPSTTSPVKPTDTTTEPGAGGDTTAPTKPDISVSPTPDPRILGTDPTDGSTTAPTNPGPKPTVPTTEPPEPSIEPEVPTTTVPAGQPPTSVVVPTGTSDGGTIGGGQPEPQTQAPPTVPQQTLVPTVPLTQVPAPGGTIR
ncbi:anti-sigma-D factor RsdA [Nocardia sp. NPDC050406]|uniref:anti-sigma-D factor RsdA n=1 Tax=Nocardia sp. NPDC050406 TaxID=3364318 RepID=UPI0037AEB462